MFSIHAPSRERLDDKVKIMYTVDFSIHAPSRERHVVNDTMTFKSMFSIHAPSRERRATSFPAFLNRSFQSTLPHGSDFHLKNMLNIPIFSIHAPSRERRLVH